MTEVDERQVEYVINELFQEIYLITFCLMVSVGVMSRSTVSEKNIKESVHSLTGSSSYQAKDFYI